MLTAAVLCLSGVAPAAPPVPPTAAAMMRAWERAQPTLVEVVGPRARGPGIIIGTEGQVLTTVRFVGLDEAKVQKGNLLFAGRVLVADAQLRCAVVTIQAPSPLLAMPVELSPLSTGDYVVGLVRDTQGGFSPRSVRVFQDTASGAFLHLAAPFPEGTPLMDVRGRLVALVVSRERSSSKALPLSRVKAALAQAVRR